MRHERKIRLSLMAHKDAYVPAVMQALFGDRTRPLALRRCTARKRFHGYRLRRTLLDAFTALRALWNGQDMRVDLFGAYGHAYTAVDALGT